MSRVFPRPAPAHGAPDQVPQSLGAVVRRSTDFALPLALMLVAASVWTTAVAAIKPDQIGDTGIVTVLPGVAYAALAAACVSFALVLRKRTPSTLLVLLHLGLLIFMLYGAPALFQEAPAFNVVWRHAGVTDFITTTGTVDPQIDAYFNWPGFFFWAALLSHVGGAHSVLAWSDWAPLAFELAYLPPLLVIARAFTSDRRIAWTAVWIFYLANWVGQDYFSPQALAYFWYLALAAVLLTYLARRSASEARPTPGKQAAVVAICIVMTAAAVASHQLTPWMMLGGTAALVIFRQCTARGLPWVILLLIVVWLTYMATAYLGGHLKLLLGQTLDVNNSLQENVASRLGGSAGHQFVVHIRLVMTGGLWLLAALGLVRRLRAGGGAAGHVILALSTPAFVLLQPYGGEMLLRVYLFSLPFTACFAAQALAPWRGWNWRAATAVACAGAVILTGFVFARYGNVASAVFMPGEVRATDRLYEIAPHGSLLLAASPNVAWKQAHYGDYHYQLVSNHFEATAKPRSPEQIADAVAAYMAHGKHQAFLLITRAQIRYDELLGAQPWGSVAALRRGVSESPRFTKLFDNGYGQIFRLRAPGRHSS